MSFDWQTEDHEWDERERRRDGRRAADLPPLNEALFGGPETTAPPAPAAAPRRRRLLYLATIGLLVVALAAVLVWQLRSNAAEAEARLTTEVAASHNAILEAAANGDGELFVSFLSGRDREWAEAQQWLAYHGGFVDRSAFGLSLTPGAPVSPTVTLAPDLRAAELTRPQSYEIAVGNGLTETVTLEQTAVYRLGPDRWLLAPPDEEFWGETATVGGRYVEVTYPARDADLAEPLARDVDAALAEFCRRLGEECAPLRLVLSTNPASFIAYDRPAGTWTGGSEIVMPAPTLFGRPADDAGRRALNRIVAARAVSAAAANFSGWRCCDDALFYGALLDAQLNQLGLQPWPVGAAEYARLAHEPELLRDIERLWRREDATAEERLLAYTLVDFLVARSNIPIPTMQRILLNDTQMPYWAWISRATNGLYGSQSDFERDLLRYAAERGLDAAARAVPLPDQVLELVCRRSDGVWPALYRYDPATGQVTLEQELAGFEEPMIAPLPGQEGVAVFARAREEPLPVTYLWRDGEARPVYAGASDGTPRLIPLPPAPSHNTLFMGQEGLPPVYTLLPLDDCLSQNSSCTTDPIRGAITYSPDGAHTLLATGEPSPLVEVAVGAPMLYLGDARGQALVAIETGFSPFWLSDDVFGYVATRRDGSGDERVVLRTLSLPTDDNPLPAISPAGDLFTVQDLEQRGPGRIESGLTIDRVLPNPTADELLVFTAGPSIATQANVALAYDLATAELQPRFAFADEQFDYRRAYRRAYRFSPDGRWLAVSTLAYSDMPQQGTVDWWVYVHATDGSLTQRYRLRAGEAWPAHWLSDWSADSHWLALATDGYVRLVAPQEDYTLPIILPDAACSAAVWVQG